MKNQPYDKELIFYKKQLYPDDKLGIQKGIDRNFYYILDWETQSYPYIGRVWKEITGFETDILYEGMDGLIRLIHPEDSYLVQRMILKWIRFINDRPENEINRFSASMDFRIRKKKGEYINVLLQSLYYSLDKKGNIVYELGMITDISHLKNNGQLLMRITGPGGKRVLEYNPKSIFEQSLNGKKNIKDHNHYFNDRIKRVINDHYYDSKFGIRELSRAMNMSRYQLHRKAKSETGFSPNALIRFYRLQKAVNLLTRKELNISQIAYKVGFSSPTYFSKCFTEEFGCSPSSFRKNPEF